MTTSLKQEVPWTVAEVATRRLNNRTGGLGYLAARDYFKKFPAQKPKGAAKPGDARREMHIQEVQNARQALIDAGIIKPVVEADNEAGLEV